MARVAFAVAVVASLAVAAPAAQAADRCQVPRGAVVKAEAKHAIAYREGSRLYACLERTGERVLLERVGRRGDKVVRVASMVLAGSHVAYAKRRTYAPYYTWGNDRVVHVDLRHPGRRDIESPWSDAGPPSAGVSTIVLAPDGAYAYTAQAFEPDPAGEVMYEERLVVAHDEVGRRTLDHWGSRTGDDAGAIDLDSLVRRHRVVSWTKDGERHSARFRDIGKCRVPPDARVERYAAGTIVYKRFFDGPWGTLACIGRIGESQLINEDSGDEYSDVYRIGGRFVAWTELVGGRGAPGDRYVRVYDLGRRRLVRDLLLKPEDCRATVEVPDIAVARSGAFAWITNFYDWDDVCPDDVLRRTRVSARDACGTIVLDEDPDIDPASLRIAGTQVRWTASGEERSAELRSADDC